MIESFKAEDVGEYICTAANQFGTAEGTIIISIGRKLI